jgi:hypothetical protein
VSGALYDLIPLTRAPTWVHTEACKQCNALALRLRPMEEDNAPMAQRNTKQPSSGRK